MAEIYLATGQADRRRRRPTKPARSIRRTRPTNFARRKSQSAARPVRRCDARRPRGARSRSRRRRSSKRRPCTKWASSPRSATRKFPSKAISFDNRAIALADTLATSKNVKERRAAKEVLIEAHLAIARQIASNKFNNKLESVSQWIGRASGLAEDMIAHDGGSVELRLLVARKSLDVARQLQAGERSGHRGSPKPSKRPTTLTQQCRRRALAATDPMGTRPGVLSRRCGSSICGCSRPPRCATASWRSRIWPTARRSDRRCTIRNNWWASCTSTSAWSTPCRSRITRRPPSGTTRRCRS